MALPFTLAEAIASLPGKSFGELTNAWKLKLAALRPLIKGGTFTEEQREAIAPWCLVVPPEALDTLSQLQGDRTIRVEPVPLADGTLVLNVDTLTDMRDGETFANLRPFLSALKIRYTTAADWPQPDLSLFDLPV